MSDPVSRRLTVVIPTFRRPERALRTLRFWAGKGFRILMLDGSDAALVLPETVRSDRDIVYLHKPEPLSARLAHAASIVETDYATLCGDDEFLLPSALRACVSFLDANLDYAACGGQTLGFSRNWLGCPRAFVKYPTFLGFDLQGAQPGDRTTRYFSNYAPAAIYAVCRSPLWAKGMRLQGDGTFPVYAIGEIFFEFFMAYCGGLRRLPQLHWLRSYETSHRLHLQKGSQDAWLSRTLTFEQVWQDEAHRTLRSEIAQYVESRMATLLDVTREEIGRDFKAAMQAYCHRPEALVPKTVAAKIGRKVMKKVDRLPLSFGARVHLLRRRGVTCDEQDIAEVLRSLRSGL